MPEGRSTNGTDMSKDGVKVYWSKRERDLMVDWDREATGANPRHIIELFPQDVLDELDRRGYDITTLRFSIKKKDDGN